MKSMLASLFTRSSQAAKGVPTRRAGRKGGFGQILASLMGKGRNKPVALVRRGREVSFDQIPFFDTSGQRLSIQTVKGKNGGKVEIKKAGKLLNSRQMKADPVLQRELILSSNRGVSQSIPGFRKRAREHLKGTAELRHGILTGKIETPGTKTSRLLAKLHEEEKKEGTSTDAVWMAQVRNHLAHMKPGTPAQQLKANAAALKSEGKDKVDVKAATGLEELADPRQPRIRKFQPERVDADATDVVRPPKVKGAKEEAADTLLKTAAKKADTHVKTAETSGNEAKTNKGVVSRITFQREEVMPPNPGEIGSRSRQLLTELKNLVSSEKAPAKESKQTATKAFETIAKPEKPLHTAADTTPKDKSAALPKAPVAERPVQRDTAQPARHDTAQRVHPKKSEPFSAKMQERAEAEAVKEQAPVAKADAKPTASAEATVAQMKRNGWRVHTPANSDTFGRQDNNGRSSRPGIRPKKAEAAHGRHAQAKPLGGDKGDQPLTRAPGDADAAAARANAQKVDSAPVQGPQAAQHKADAPSSQTVHHESAAQNQNPSKGLQNLDQVLQKMEAHAKVLHGNGRTSIRVNLKPASLGELTVHIHEHKGHYEVSLQTQSADAAKVVEHHLPQIREHLANQGVDVQKFNVDSGSGRQQAFAQEDGGSRRESSGRASRGGRGTGRREAVEQVAVEERSTPRRLAVGTNTVDYVG